MRRNLAAVSWGGAALCSALGWSGDASASGFASGRFGGEHGNVTETNPTALYFNPAGIGFSAGTHLFLDGSLALRHATWEHQKSATDAAEPPGAEGANFGTAKLFNVFGGPALGFTHALKLGTDSELAFGAGLFVPFAGRAHWDENGKFSGSSTFPLAADGVQRWHSIEGALTFIYLTTGVAYRIGPFSFGVSGNYIVSEVKAKQAKNTVDSSNNMANDGEGRSEIDVKGKHGSFGVGLMYEAIPKKLWLGASYQAVPGLGKMKLSGTLTTTTYSAGVPSEGHAEVDFYHELPDVIRLGGRYRASDSLELRLFGDYTRWSKYTDQCIATKDLPCGIDVRADPANFRAIGAPAPGTGTANFLYRGWVDTWGVRAGASYWMKPEVELFGGLGFETSAVPDASLDPGLPDSKTVAIAAGGRFEVAHGLFVAGSYTHIQYLPRDNTGKSVINDPAVDPTTRRVDGGGKFTAWIGIVNANLEYQF